MRLVSALFLATLAASLATGTSADERGKYKRKYDDDRTHSGYRSSTVDHRGLCQRDNGRPLDSLKLNHECDRREFWARFNDLGGDGRR